MVCVKYRAPHYEKFNFSIIPSRTKRSTSFLNIYSYDFSTGYGCIHIDLTFYFNSKPAGYDFFVPSFTFNNSSKKFNRLSKSFCWKIYGGFDISTSNQYLGISTITSYFYLLSIYWVSFWLNSAWWSWSRLYQGSIHWCMVRAQLNFTVKQFLYGWTLG